MHIWLGNFQSEREFEKYLDQKEYLDAWAIYDNELPTGNEDDVEPDTELRCDFCKEVNLYTYDEDSMIMKYYQDAIEIRALAKDILADEEELGNVWKKHTINNANAVIAYKVNDLSEEDASNSKTVEYLGKITRISAASTDDFGVHHLWVGRYDFEKEEIKEIIDVDENEIIDLNFYYSYMKEKLDDMIINRIEDFNVAEKMILKADEMKIPNEVNAILDLFLNETSEIDGKKIGMNLGMKYIGRFEVE